MLKMGIKFFDGPLTEIEKAFNKWSEGKYVNDTTLHLKRNRYGDQDGGVLKVVYGDKQGGK